MKHLFLKSVADNNIDAVKTYLNDPSFEKDWMDTLNLSSLIQNSPKIAILLIQKGIDINVTIYDNFGGKPLLAYAIDNKLDAVTEALLARDDLNVNEAFYIPSVGSTSLLIHAFNQKANEVVKALLARDDIDLSARLNGGSILNKAIENKDIELVTDILNHKNFNTDLLQNVYLGDVIQNSPEIAILLIQKGIDINVTIYDNFGGKPLLAYAIDNKLDAVTEALLARDDLNVNEAFYIPSFGSTSLLIHAFNQKANEVVNALLARDDIDLSAMLNGGSILNKAIGNKDIELVTDILNHKNFNTDLLKNVNLGWVIQDSPEIGILLINKEIDINVTIYDNFGGKPLLAYAIDNKLDAVTEALLARDDLNVNEAFYIPSFGSTSLLIHAFNQKANEVVKALLARDDIDLSAMLNGGSILNKAIGNKDIELVTDILNHKNFNTDLLKNVNLGWVIQDSPEIGILLINKEIDINVVIYDNSESKPLLAYAIDNKLDALTEALLARDDLKMSQNECDLVITYLNQHLNIKPSESLVKELILNSEIDKIIEYLKQINFDWATKFNNGETILHLLLGRNDADNAKTLEYADDLLQQNTPSNEPVINVNQRDNNGDRVIDVIKNKITNEYQAFIKLLRDYGSVEPKEPISSLSISKLILDNGTDTPPDGIAGNKEKAQQILQLMFNKYKLTDQEIDNEIIQFKANQDLTTTAALWGEGTDNVLKVVEKLSTMNHVQDRLTVSWDFKKVLGILIHITKNNGDTSNLIYTLSQIKMCDLSKLINLLAVGQDEIIESIEVDYTKKTFEDFEYVLELIPSVALSILEDKMTLAFVKWKNDLANKVAIKDPEQWCPYTQKIQGIFNKIFAEHVEGVTNFSYHFTDGLKLKIINPLIEKIISNAQATSEIQDLWKNIIEQGAALLATEFFDKIVSGEKAVDSIEEGVYDYPLSFGQLPLLDVSTIKHYYDLINEKYGITVANQFAYLLQDNCALNHEVEDYLHYIHENSNHDDNSVSLQGDSVDYL